MVRRIVVTGSETRSEKRAVLVLNEGGIQVSAKTVERVLHDVGGELADRRDDPACGQALAKRPENAPDLAVVECDGGRIRCRQPGHGPGVYLEGKGWRETKIACLIRAKRTTFEEDPQPEPPACFANVQHVAKIAETEALAVASPQSQDDAGSEESEEAQEPLIPAADWRPKRLVRTVLASLADSNRFGRQMRREAKGRRFFEASGQAFLGDGLPWNWSIWKKHFYQFTPILDFIHVLSYLFLAAKAVHAEAADAWDQYLVWMRGCWQGEVQQVLDELTAWQSRLGEPPPDAAENDPREVLRKTLHYLQSNRSRMDYPRYRQLGLPVTTAWMESLVKEINYRVKGTEMFWNDPEGAESILQVRAAALCDDERLTAYLNTRPGSPFTRRRTPPKPPREKIKS